MTLFNYDVFKMDVEKKQFSEMKHLHTICSEIGISRVTGHRIKTKQPLTLETFLKVVNWLGTDMNRYLKKGII